MPETSQTKKTVIFTDYNCNNNCIFCIDKNKRAIKGKDFKLITKEIKEAKERGTTYLEFIGGEVTIRKDSLDIFSYAKKVGFDTIALVTNGRMLSYKDYARKLLDSGVSHLVISIHGHTKTLHDKLTESEGSYEQMIKGLANLRSLGFDNIGSNTTIVKQNYKYLPRIGQFLLDNKIYNSEFIFVDPNYGAAKDNFKKLVPHISVIAPYVRKCLALKKGDKLVNHWHIRYVPLCYFVEFLDQVSEIEEVKRFKTEHIAPDFVNLSVEESRASVGRIKTKRCDGCKLFDICEGVWKEYIEQYGDSELKLIR